MTKDESAPLAIVEAAQTLAQRQQQRQRQEALGKQLPPSNLG